MIPNIKVAVHPGEILKDCIENLGMSQRQFADLIGKKQAEVSYIINSDRDINADRAIRLSIVCKTSPDFWLGMQYAYDVKKLSNSDRQKEYLEVQNKSEALGIA